MVEPTPPRAIRVFISSTFRDMMRDREELVARAFPAVRRVCEARGVTWSEVDLRWGVTDEQKAEGAVLPICLEEIERSRPYFIGLVGERYGWVPDEIPAELAARLGWLQASAGRSVTELEILHGVLNDPASAGHAFFYRRDPGWVATLPEAERSDHVDDDREASAKLADLVARIRASGHPVRDYPDPVRLGELVRADLLALVDSLFPGADLPDPFERDEATHAAYAATRFDGYVERPRLAAQLDDLAGGSGPPVLVTGPVGSGCSALVANWVRGWRAAHPSDLVVEHYVGADAAAADWRLLAARLAGGLARASGNEPPTLPEEVGACREALADAFRTAASGGQRIVLVLDGIDQLADVDAAPDLAWLPDPVPALVRIVATASGGRALDVAAGRGWTLLAVPPLDAAERTAVVSIVLARYAKALGPEHLARVVGAPLAGNALWLRTVLDELRQHGDHFTLDAALDRLLAAGSVDDLFELVLGRYERDYERDRLGLVRDAMAALWAARRGLGEAELLDVLGDAGKPLPHAHWSPLLLAAERGLATRSGQLGFATAPHRQAVEDRYLADAEDQRAAHARLAAYFASQPMGPRVADELPWQQLGAGDLGGLAASLADLDLLDLAYRRSLADVRRLWVHAESAGHRLVDGYAAVVADPASVPRDRAWMVARLLTDGGYPVEALRLHRHLVDATRASGDADALRAALVNLGGAQWQQGELADAEGSLAEAAELARAAGDAAVEQAAVANLALVRRERGDLDGALPLFETAERLAGELGDADGVQIALGNRAQLLRQLGDRDAALAALEEQERVCRTSGDRAGVARARAGQAAVLADRGQVAEALALRAEHEAVCREVGDLRGLAECLLSNAVDWAQVGDLAGAGAAADEAESVARRLGDLGLVARVLLARVNAAAAIGAWAEVERLGREAELSARSAGVPAPAATALGLVGIARRELGDLAGSRAAHDEQERVAQTLGDPGELAVAASNLAAVDIAEGRLADAVARLDRAESVFRTQGTVHNLAPLLANRGQVHHHLGDVARAVPDLLEGGELALRLGNAPLAQQLLTTAVELLYAAGRAAEAEAAWQHLAEATAVTGDEPARQRALGERALLLLGRGQLDAAAPLLDEQKGICRRIGDQVGLAACVGNRAILLRQRGDLAGSLACIDEQLAVARASGNAQGVLFATANRGDVLGAMGRVAEGIAALEEARTMATQWGLTPMVAELDQLRAALRSS